jgi:hypothetical protein
MGGVHEPKDEMRKEKPRRNDRPETARVKPRRREPVVIVVRRAMPMVRWTREGVR